MGEERHEVRRLTVPRWATGVLGAFVLALVSLASLDGRPLLDTRTTPDRAVVPARPPAPTSHEVTPTTVVPVPRDDTVLPTWLSVPTLALVLFLAAVLVAVAAWVLRRRGRLLVRQQPPSTPRGDGLDLESLMTVEDAAQQTARLREGTPRNGVVAAWLELERLVAERGVTRHPSETSTELVVRVLGHAAVPREPLADLSSLFREARFSEHDLTEEHRARAAADLDALHSALGVGATGTRS